MNLPPGSGMCLTAMTVSYTQLSRWSNCSNLTFCVSLRCHQRTVRVQESLPQPGIDNSQYRGRCCHYFSPNFPYEIKLDNILNQ